MEALDEAPEKVNHWYYVGHGGDKQELIESDNVIFGEYGPVKFLLRGEFIAAFNNYDYIVRITGR